jgi:uncharacterized protein (DUF924 family)
MATAHWTELLDFWFAPPGSPEHGRPRACWFRKSAAFDAVIRARFLATHEAALAGALDAWRGRPLSALALIVALDQFPRNLFRDDPRAYSADARALEIARDTVAQGFDRVLLPVQRCFVYLPFEHAEDLAWQRESLRRFASLAEESGWDSAGASTFTYAMLHYAVIARFGRFPHRNAVLGRSSTEAEAAFLGRPGSSF